MTTLSHILGVDPGLTGGFALVPTRPNLPIRTFATPTITRKGKTTIDGPMLAAWLDCHRNLIKHAYVEAVNSRPRQAGQFQFGINTGMVHGMLYANIIPWSLVTPAIWKFHYGIKRINDESYRDKKNDARALAQALWPQHAKAFARVKDDGVAEAALIAAYGVHQQTQTPT